MSAVPFAPRWVPVVDRQHVQRRQHRYYRHRLQLELSGLSVTGTARVNVAASSGSGAGTVRLDRSANDGANASLTVGSGTLAFNVNSGTASIGPNSSIAVNSGAVLQLAGTHSALFDGTSRQH